MCTDGENYRNTFIKSKQKIIILTVKYKYFIIKLSILKKNN